MSSSITLKTATEADIPALADVAIATFTEAFGHLYAPKDLQLHLDNKCSEAFFTKAMKDKDQHIVIAWEGDKAVGYVKWGPLELPAEDAPKESCEIHRLYVRASHQRLGLGRQLMDVAMEGCTKGPIYLGVWENNNKAQAFYKGYGFIHAGEHIYLVGEHADRDLIWVRHG